MAVRKAVRLLGSDHPEAFQRPEVQLSDQPHHRRHLIRLDLGAQCPSLSKRKSGATPMIRF